MKTLFKLKTNLITVIAVSILLCISCSKEEEVVPQSEGITETEQIQLEPKTLATIQLSNTVEIIFKTEEDGVVFEAVGKPSEFNGLGSLEKLSILERFLKLTSKDVLVPEDLIQLEENARLKNEALQRGTIEKHVTKLQSTIALSSLKLPALPAHCSGTPGNYDTDAFGQFYRTYKNYLTGASGTTIYSSWKSGGNKCKTINMWLSNCSNSKTLKVKTYYKNVVNKYKHRNTISFSPNTRKFWSKTYASKRYRRINVNNTGHRFGGYLLFRNY